MFLIINSEGMKTQESIPDLQEMKRLVGVENESAYIEFVFRQFSDLSIALVCDDEFVLKNLSPTCRTKQHILCGQILVVALRNDGEIQSLTAQQIEQVKQELQLLATA